MKRRSKHDQIPWSIHKVRKEIGLLKKRLRMLERLQSCQWRRRRDGDWVCSRCEDWTVHIHFYRQAVCRVLRPGRRCERNEVVTAMLTQIQRNVLEILDRALRVWGQQSAWMEPFEIRRRTGLTTGSVARSLRKLVEIGVVEQRPTGLRQRGFPLYEYRRKLT